MATVIAVCAGEDRQKPKRALECGLLRRGEGTAGDGHFGMGDRQVSLLRSEDGPGGGRGCISFPRVPWRRTSWSEGCRRNWLPGHRLVGAEVVPGSGRKGEKARVSPTPTTTEGGALPTAGYFLKVLTGGGVTPATPWSWR